MKLGIDPGKWGTKAVTKDDKGQWEYFYVRSKMQKNPESVIGGENYLIEYQGETILIGEAAGDYSLDTDKQTLQHKLCTYLAISQLAQDETCKAVIGCPFNLYKNVDKREEYENYMKDSSLINFKVNKEDVLINIAEDGLMAFPEAAGIAYSEPDEDFEETLRGVIDFGGLNVNGGLFENYTLVPGSDFTENLGSIILKNTIKDELNKCLYLNLQDHDITTILKKGLYINGKRELRADKIIENVIDEHFKSIIKVAKKHNWSISTLDITLGGGGITEIGNSYCKFIPQAKVSNNGIWGNAMGNYNVAEMHL